MKVAIIASNYLKINKNTKKGTEIIVYDFVNALVRLNEKKELDITVFVSEDSDLPVKIESIACESSAFNPQITKTGKRFIFELALLSKAFSYQEEYDLFHINIGDGDIALPFAPFVKKPILITLYHLTDLEFAEKYLTLFKKHKNIFFVSPTEIQKKRLPF
ncbi:hypothetical protein KKG52_00155 [Patescibacteria group bacterium]|nr:hypothetical protein [Patescibacteria group bacterium]